ncbi:SLBB domain-containing protein [Verrucomicrobiaceae bacterium N1E253]|uniref:SLBB domain-containing protein n=1 Tax=Oceaniferula marina TaxID=2748318 RepID=A0A851GL35_9BACT|nr:VIT domain-containing protein [Oceaniferula marina]NWK55797.1 SLBB domain-containing protein [Oceaniferula marina]
MKFIFTLILLGLTPLLQAALPTMWVKDKGGRVPLKIDHIHAEVRVVQDLAETTLTLRFRNETKRMQEGEFVLPLPEGATVSGYALEINGELRNGVAVEKLQARHAYESIKRQMIDPGLVEREANNTYRTKVFPIPAEGTKRVRISYTETLREHDKQLLYTLPTQTPGAVDTFICDVHFEQSKTPQIDTPSLEFETISDTHLQAKAEHITLKDPIKIQCPQDQSSVVITGEYDDQTYLYLRYKPMDDIRDMPRKAVQHIHLIWDASDSRRTQNHQAELALLDAYFQKLAEQGPVKVSLQFLRNRLIDAGSFTIQDGQWKTLRDTLEKTFYDGSTHRNAFAEHQPAAELTMVFTDVNRSKQALPLQVKVQPNTFIFHCGQGHTFSSSELSEGVTNIQLEEKPHRGNINKALHQLTHTAFKIESIELEGSQLIACLRSMQQSQALVGTIPGKPTKQIKIIWKNGNGQTIEQPLSTTVVRDISQGDVTLQNAHMLERLFAQERLNQLERTLSRPVDIIKHCRRYGLVSDHTSLIVLERFEDYVRYNIPPPEPALRKKWETQRQQFEQQKTKTTSQTDGLPTRLHRAWQLHLQWHLRTFPWRSKVLQNHLRQSSLWLDACKSLFQPEDLDSHSHGIIETWHQQTFRFIRNAHQIRDNASHQQWKRQQDQLIREWAKFPTLEVKRKPGQALAVSIRGLVQHPDTYRLSGKLTLKQAITRAGGLHPAGNLQYISLYRNAHATTYNLLSQHYQDIPLQPGDMVVASPIPWEHYSDDPFGAFSPQPARDPSRAPAISHTPKVSGDDFDGSSDDGSSDDPFGGGDHRKKYSPTKGDIRILPPLAPAFDKKRLLAFERALKQKTNEQQAYDSWKKLKQKHALPAPIYLEAARILARNQHQELAIQVLSNLREHPNEAAENPRAWAYLLGAIGRFDLALPILRQLQQSHPDTIQNQLDLIRYRQKVQPDRPAAFWAKQYHELVTSLPASNRTSDAKVLALALIERNAYLKRPLPEPAPDYSNNLSSDLRIVVYPSNPEAKLQVKVKEPVDDHTSRWHDSIQGGRLHYASSIQEYRLRHAMPGKYQLSCTSRQPLTLQIAIYTHWGKPNQACHWTTVTLNESSSWTPVAECDLSYDEEEK